ncbi:MAG TPA: glycosyltransferase family 87 protein [Acidobacteriaceae bacterium]
MTFRKAQDEQGSGTRSRDKRLLVFVVASLLLANVVQWAVCRLLGLGNPGGLKGLVRAFVHVSQWTDSWQPMMKSLDYFQANPAQPIYAAKLYDTLLYPLASLLPLVFLRKLGLSDAAMLRVLAWASWLAVLGVAAMSIALARRLLRERGAALTWASTLAIVLAVMGCYPLLKGYALGNAQTFLSLGFIVMLYLWTAGRERSAGVVAALLTMVKPQFVLLLLWMAVRRRWGAMWAFVVCVAVVMAASIAVFGWHNNLDYIGVLAGLSHKAQSHFANQSMFGTINRMIFNGENLGYTPYVYTPYIPWVYRVTVLTAVLIVGAALAFPWGRLRGSTADIAAMGLASVAASPMAWEHHYGIVVGIFVWAWFAYGCWQRKGPWLLGLAFFLTMNFLAATNLLADRRGWNVLQSYMYFGALLLLFVLMRLARRVTRGDAVVL